MVSGRPAGSGWSGPRRPLVNLRLEPDVLTRIDTARGDHSRSAWLRGAIDAALAHPDRITPR
jgi:hypothetical protein